MGSENAHPEKVKWTTENEISHIRILALRPGMLEKYATVIRHRQVWGEIDAEAVKVFVESLMCQKKEVSK